MLVCRWNGKATSASSLDLVSSKTVIIEQVDSKATLTCLNIMNTFLHQIQENPKMSYFVLLSILYAYYFATVSTLYAPYPLNEIHEPIYFLICSVQRNFPLRRCDN